MESETIVQPQRQLGTEIRDYLQQNPRLKRIVLVSAFASLSTILRLRDQLLAQRQAGCDLRIVIGIDLGGTSREVLEELLRWDCNVAIFHNASPRATFHPKVYWFEATEHATLIIGSNNMTEGGFFTNHEAAVRQAFDLPLEQEQYEHATSRLMQLIDLNGSTTLALTPALVETLCARGAVPSESEQRAAKRSLFRSHTAREGQDPLPPNPFGAIVPALPPLLPQEVRADERVAVLEEPLHGAHADNAELRGDLVWEKKLPASDALETNEGSNSVGGVRLTQAGFENPAGQRIDQTTYFRNLFRDSFWEPEPGRVEKEHAFVPMQVVIKGHDYGVQNFEISHKPSGEAGQSNYTTILKWGRQFSPTIKELALTGSTLRLFEFFGLRASFLLEID